MAPGSVSIKGLKTPCSYSSDSNGRKSRKNKHRVPSSSESDVCKTPKAYGRNYYGHGVKSPTVDDSSDSTDEFRVRQIDHSPKIDFYDAATPHTAILEFKEGVKLYVVSEYLEKYSSVYKNLLNESSDDGKIFIDNASAKEFEEMLQVIHPNGKRITAENCATLLKLAVQFDVPGLVQMCVDALKTVQYRAKMKEILDILDVAFMNKLDDLTDSIAGSRFDFGDYISRNNVKSKMGKSAFEHLRKLSVETREFVFSCILKLNEGSKKNKKTQEKIIDRTPKFNFMNADSGHDKVVSIEEKEFYVTAKYLAMWSDYFSNDEDYVVVQDISAEDFEEFLNVIYPSQKPITKDNCASVLKLAFRFDAPGVIQKCSNFICQNFRSGVPSGPEVFDIFQVVFDHNMEDLKMMFVLECGLHGYSDRVLSLSSDAKEFILKKFLGDFDHYRFKTLDEVKNE